jgi:hypothetical protein
MKAFSLLPDRFEDGRHTIFKTGLREVGYEIVEGLKGPVGKDDLILGWNAYGPTYQAMRDHGANGARALVFEESYVRRIDGQKYFALAVGGHNGFGTWRIGGPERWRSWNVPVEPWRATGDHILVCGQRGFGYNAMAMPADWPDTVFERLREITDRPLWFRAHPKRRARMPSVRYDRMLDWNEPIAAHLDNAWACVVYTSNSATDALIHGVPAFCDGPAIVSEPATERGIAGIETPSHRDREDGFVRLSWAQWSVAELESGAAFRWLLG